VPLNDRGGKRKYTIAEKEVKRLRKLIRAIEKVNQTPILYVDSARAISAQISDMIWHGVDEFDKPKFRA